MCDTYAQIDYWKLVHVRIMAHNFVQILVIGRQQRSECAANIRARRLTFALKVGAYLFVRLFVCLCAVRLNLFICNQLDEST